MKQSKIFAVDLAPDNFEVAIATRAGRSRSRFRQLLATEASALVLMEALGTALYWGREARSHGHQPKIIPAQYVKLYRRRNKIDRADCSALLEARRCAEIKPVPVRSVEQQQIQQLHRIRE